MTGFLAWLMLRGAFGRFLAGVLQFCSRPPGSWLVSALAVLLLVVGIYYKGLWDGDARTEARFAAADLAAHQTISLAGTSLQGDLKALDSSLNAHLEVGRERIVYVTKTLQAEIPAHVTPKVDANYPVSCGLVRMHDGALFAVSAASLDPAACGPDDGSAKTKASDLAGAIVQDWRYAHELEVQRDGWREYALGLVKAWNDYRDRLMQSDAHKEN